MSFGFLKSVVLVAIVSVTARLALAEETTAPSSFSLRGFGTLGIARSSAKDVEFVRDLSQPIGIKDGQWSSRPDTLFGLQGAWAPTRELEFSTQIISRLRYDRSRDPEVMWAIAKWDPTAHLTLRAGRIGADFMLLADSRMVAFSYLTVRPPSDFFGPLFFSHFDGGDVTLTYPLDGGLIKTKVFAGWMNEKTAGTPGIWDTRRSPVDGFVLDYLKGPWQFRANFAQIKFSSNINFGALPVNLSLAGAGAASESLVTKGKYANFYSTGFVFDQSPWTIQGMVSHIQQESGVFQNSEAAYLLAGYKVRAITPFVGISRWISHRKNQTTGLPAPAFDALNVPYDEIQSLARANQTTTTLGVRWDVHSQVALKAQLDRVRGKPDSRFPYARSSENWNGKTDVFSLNLDYVF